MLKPIGAVLAAALVLAGCKTTQEAAQSIRAKWIGQPIDRFFVENGPPVSSFALEGGGTIYTWRGGETSYIKPAQYQTQPAFRPVSMPATVKTTTVTSNPSPGVTMTSTTTTRSSIGYNPPTVTTMVRPAERVNLFCEAQITADEQGTIMAVRINRDTQGAMLSFSRCGEIFGD